VLDRVHGFAGGFGGGNLVVDEGAGEMAGDGGVVWDGTDGGRVEGTGVRW
jgi:hypothetical protein